MSVRIQLRRDTAANWASTNPTLTQGEPGYETDTGKIKYGDGTTAWNSLAYAPAAAIADGTILNADVSNSAAIAGTKINPDFGSQNVTTTGNVTINAQGDLRFGDADSSNWVALQSPSTVASNVTWTLPSADGTTGQVLSTNGSGTLAWATGGTVTSVAASSSGSITVSGSPITSSGTLTFNLNTANANSFTGEQTFKEIKETTYTLGTSGTISLDPANGSIQRTVLTGNPTFTDALQAGQTIVLQIENGASYTVTWPTTTWATSSGNTAPTLTAKDVLVFWKFSTTLYGAYVGSYV